VDFTVYIPEGIHFTGQTVNGSIEAEDLSGDVEASIFNGDIYTDFSLTMEGKFASKRIRGTIGSGGPKIKLSTVNGSITLLHE
jgi:DUF4097 and DUF4098 domain-containing protein YvlB